MARKRVRELRNVIERAVILVETGPGRANTIEAQHFPPNMSKQEGIVKIGNLVSLEVIEELHIRGVLASTKSLETAAQILGIDYATLWRRRKNIRTLKRCRVSGFLRKVFMGYLGACFCSCWL